MNKKNIRERIVFFVSQQNVYIKNMLYFLMSLSTVEYCCCCCY